MRLNSVVLAQDRLKDFIDDFLLRSLIFAVELAEGILHSGCLHLASLDVRHKIVVYRVSRRLVQLIEASSQAAWLNRGGTSTCWAFCGQIPALRRKLACNLLHYDRLSVQHVALRRRGGRT